MSKRVKIDLTICIVMPGHIVLPGHLSLFGLGAPEQRSRRFHRGPGFQFSPALVPALAREALQARRRAAFARAYARAFCAARRRAPHRYWPVQPGSET